ncbi:MAG: hypothetical protein SGILL_002273 [Bacillariaceae sp.]
MKISIALLAMAATSATAFTMPSQAGSRTVPTALFLTPVEDAIREAKEATDKFGASSPEAAAAWDIVEEMDASTFHHKKEAKKVEEQVVSHGDKKFTVSDEYANALADAKAVTEEKGIQSSEARLAWELVEELGATQSHHKSVGSG